MTVRTFSVVLVLALASSHAGSMRAQAPQSQSPASARVYPVDTAGLTPPVRLREVKLTYPDEAMRARIQGTVGLSITVNADGTVRDAMVTKSVSETTGFDAAAVEAASKWAYQPGKLNNNPVAVRLDISLGASFH